MNYTLALAVAILIVLFVLWRKGAREDLVDLVEKQIPRPLKDPKDSVIIESIPLQRDTPQIEIDDAPTAPVYSDEKPPITLTFDAAVARNALMRSRDKRVYDAIANRTTDYWRPFFEEELRQCEYRDWWDDVAYPMNDSGETVITPEQSPSDREETPWNSESVPFARTI